MDTARALIFFVLLWCISNILKILNGKGTYSNNNNYYRSNSTTSYSGNNVRGHYRKCKNGKTTYVRAHKRKR